MFRGFKRYLGTRHVQSLSISALLAVSVAFLLLLASCSSDENVLKVKGSKLSAYPSSKTIGEAIDAFFADAKWSSGTSDKGVAFVNAEGKITYADKEVTAVLQFQISKDGKTFQVNALEFNGVPQNQLMINGLLAKIYEK